MANENIKKLMKQNKVKYWQLADALEISENTLYRRFRHELNEPTRKNYVEIIEKIGRGDS